jgi:uncharacterized SAM-binding protein YcdF (DUF218 family)
VCSLPLSRLTPFFSSVGYSLTLTGVLALSHGWLCCSCFILAPAAMSTDADKAKAGTLAYLFVTIGVVVGTGGSIVLRYTLVPAMCGA